jgi:quercetin dioxygenase-like cupin family protein
MWSGLLTSYGKGGDVRQKLTIVCLAAGAIAVSSDHLMGQAATTSTIYRSPGGTTLKLMLDDTNVGSAVTLAEMAFPANTDSGDHQHGAIEMFYVISGELEHVVNGHSYVLKPGMAGYVKPPDTIRHKTGPAGAKVVVVWVPGDEGKKIAARWKKEP